MGSVTTTLEHLRCKKISILFPAARHTASPRARQTWQRRRESTMLYFDQTLANNFTSSPEIDNFPFWSDFDKTKLYFDQILTNTAIYIYKQISNYLTSQPEIYVHFDQTLSINVMFWSDMEKCNLLICVQNKKFDPLIDKPIFLLNETKLLLAKKELAMNKITQKKGNADFLEYANVTTKPIKFAWIVL